MRICSPHCGLEPNSDSGGAVYEREILGGLARLWTDLHLPMPRGKVVPEALAWAVEPVWFRRWRWWLAAPVVARAIRQCWDRHGFDLLRAHSARFIGPGAILARPPGRALVVHHHHLDGIWQERIDLAVLRRADLVTTDSEWSRQALIATGVRRPIKVIRAGVADRFFVEDDRRDGRTLLFVGGLKARKNPALLPAILRAVLDRGQSAELRIVGDGPLRAEVLRQVRRRRLEQGIHFLGRLPDTEVARQYAQADVFVFPTRLEGFGMPVLESMAAGCVPVASAVGAIPEVIEDGRTGFLVKDPDDIDGFAERITELLAYPSLRHQMALRGRAEASRWTWARAALKLERLCRGLL